jgi:hypothetical protein
MHPAIGHDHLMHFYECPSSCHQTDYCLCRFPKHFRCQIQVNEETQDAFAWGIELVEGVDWACFGILGFVVVIVSTAFGIAWACRKGSIQDGFTVATYIITVFTSMAGAMQIAFDRI